MIDETGERKEERTNKQKNNKNKRKKMKKKESYGRPGNVLDTTSYINNIMI